MSIMFVIFGVMYAFFYSISLYKRNEEILGELIKVERSFYEGKVPVTFDFLIAEISNDEFIIVSKSSNFPDSVFKKISKQYESNSDVLNSYKSYYYKTSINNETNKNLIFIADMSQTISIYRNASSLVLYIEFVAFIIIFLIVLLISKNLFKPIRDTLINHKKFLSDASHELKTPIAIISANADVIKNTDDSEWINNIKAQTERMDLLVKDLLSLSAIDEKINVKTKKKFNLSEEILKTTLFFEALAFEKGKRVITDVTANLNYVGDVVSVRKIIEILLDNAIKYATKNTDILVSLKTSGKKHVLTVYNEGSNVPSSDAKKIFERFYRGDNSRSRESGGSGLGLSIAKSLCTLNKWKISVKCEYNGYMQIKVIM